MSRRRGQSLAPSLFPFLAVLVCTLGTLILLLALVAQNATDSAEQQARSVAKQETEPETTAPRISATTASTLLEEERFRVDRLIRFRDQQTAEMEERRDELTHIEDHMNRLREQLKTINQEVERATGEAETETIDAHALATLKQQIDDQQEVVDKLREDASDQTPRVVIVPHKGPNGTDRRPIYLECTSEGITVWPEGSKITMSELEDAAYSANPLDAALRIIRLHAMQNEGDTVSPYPLLVVRPDGIQAYGAARRAMSDWDDQFGYELVPESVKLAYGDSDQDLKRRVDVAIRTAARQQISKRGIAGSFGTGGRSSFGSPVGRSVGSSAGGDRRRLPILSAAQLDRQGRSGGFAPLRDSRSIAGANRQGYPPSTQRRVGSGIQPNRYAGGNGFGQTPVDEAAQSARNLANQMESAAREMRGRGNSSGRGNDSNDPFGASSLEGTSSSNDPLTADRQGPDGLPSDPSSLADLAGTSKDAAGNPSEFASTQQAQRGSTNNRTGRAGSSSQYSDNAGGGAQQSSNSAMSQSNSRSGQTGSMPSTFSQSPQTQNGRPPALDMPSGAPDMSQQRQMRNPSELVRRSGQDWALPSHMVGIKGGDVVRSIRAECYADRFVLPASKNGSLEMFGLNDIDVESATLRLATALRDRIDRWGPALPGARWQPRLEVIVHPGGETRYRQLQTIMNGSGIDVVGRSAP